jgi:hypothetical protein
MALPVILRERAESLKAVWRFPNCRCLSFCVERSEAEWKRRIPQCCFPICCCLVCLYLYIGIAETAKDKDILVSGLPRATVPLGGALAMTDRDIKKE